MTSWARRLADPHGGSNHHQYSGPSLIPASSSQPIEYIANSGNGDHNNASSRFRHTRGGQASGTNSSRSLSSTGLNLTRLFSHKKGKSRQFDNALPSQQLHRDASVADDWELVHATTANGKDDYSYSANATSPPLPPSSRHQQQAGLGLTLEAAPPRTQPSELRLSTGEAFLMANGGNSASRDSTLFRSRRRKSSAKTSSSSSKSNHLQRHSISMMPPMESQTIQPAERSQRIDAAEAQAVFPLLAPDQVRGLSPSINAQLQSFAFPTAGHSPDPAINEQPDAARGDLAASSRQLRGKSRSMGNALELANMADFERASYERRKSKPSLPSSALPPAVDQPNPPPRETGNVERQRAISMMDTAPPPPLGRRTESFGSIPTVPRPPSRNLARKFSLLRYGRGGAGADQVETTTTGAPGTTSSSGVGTQSTPRRRPDNLAIAASTSSSMPNDATAASHRKSQSASTSPFSFRKLSIRRQGGSRNEQVRTPEIQSWRDQGIHRRRQSQAQQEELIEPPIMLVQPDYLQREQRRPDSSVGDHHGRASPLDASAPSSLKRNNSGSLSLRKRWQTRSKSFDILSRSSRSNPGSVAGSTVGSEVSSSAVAAGISRIPHSTTSMSSSTTPTHRRVQDTSAHDRHGSPSRDSVVPRKPVPSYGDNQGIESASRHRKISNPTSVLTSASVANESIFASQPPAAPASAGLPRGSRLRGRLSPQIDSFVEQEGHQHRWGPSSISPSSSTAATHFPLSLDAMSIHHGETTDGGVSDVASTIRPQRMSGDLLRQQRSPPVLVREESYDADQSSMPIVQHPLISIDGQLLAPSDAQSGAKKSDPNDSIGSTNSAGRPYSMISMGSGDTPIVRYRRLVVDTTEEGEPEDADQPDDGPQIPVKENNGLWFRKPGKPRGTIDRAFDGEISPSLRQTDGAFVHTEAEGVDEIAPLAPTNSMDRRTSAGGNSHSTKRGSILTSDGDTALSALEAEVTTAKRLVVGRSRANTLDLMKHIEQEQSASEGGGNVEIPKLQVTEIRLPGATPPLKPDVHSRAEAVAVDSTTSRPSRRDEPWDWNLHGQRGTFVASKSKDLPRSASSLGLTSASSEDENGRRASPLIEGLRTTKSVFLPNSTVPKLPSSSALRRSRSALASRSTPNSSPDEGVKPDEFEPPRPHLLPTGSKVSFRTRNEDVGDENNEDEFTAKARHIRSKSSLRSRNGKKQTFATSEEAIQARQREEQGKEKRRVQREREKEKMRQRRYADMKKNDPLLAERLALVGLKPGVGLGVDVGAEADAQEQWPSTEVEEPIGHSATDVPQPTTSSPPRLPPIAGIGNRTSLEDSISFERPKRTSLLSQNPVNAEAEIVTPTRGTASGLMAGLQSAAAGSPTVAGSHRRTTSLFADAMKGAAAGAAPQEMTGAALPSSHRPTKSLSHPAGVTAATNATTPAPKGRVRGDSNATASVSASQLGTPIPSLDFPDPPERARESRSADGTVLSMGELTSPMTQWTDEAQKIPRSFKEKSPRPPLFIYAAAPDLVGAAEVDQEALSTSTPRTAAFPRRDDDDGGPAPVLKTIRRSRSKVIKPPAPVGPRPQPASPQTTSPAVRSANLSSSFGLSEGGDGYVSANDGMRSGQEEEQEQDPRYRRSVMVEVEEC